MSLLSRTRSALRAFFPPKLSARSYNGAKGGRLFADWATAATSADAEIRGNIRVLIDRSRSLERDNDYQRGFLLSCERNVIGAIRNDLRMDCGEYKFAKGKPPKWEADKAASSQIEAAWMEWGKKGTCTVCGRYSWREVKQLAVRSVPRDGNFIARKIVGAAAGNRFGFALQIWEIDHLDLTLFKTLPNGNEIKFGIETNVMGRVAAYWLRASHPGDASCNYKIKSQTERFPEEEIFHLFIAERPEQSIGVPWIVSAITRLRQLGAFEEAAVIAARIGASKAGFFKKVPGPNGETGSWSGETNSEGRAVMDAEPGTFEEMPEGWDLAQWSPEYPNIETGDFRKAMLRGVSTALGVSYNTLGSDLESVSFSAARIGIFEEREGWKALQARFTESFFEPVFSYFLETAILAGAINLPLAKMAKLNRPIFKGRRWPFIDPLKEVEAASRMIALRVSSRRQFVEEIGGDIDDVMHDNLDDENLAEDIGLSLTPPDPSPEAFGSTDAPPAEPTGDEPLPPAARGKKKPFKPAPTASEIAAEVIRQTPPVERAPVPPPSITINNAPPAVTVNTPAVNVAAPEVRNTVNVPAPAAPTITVNVPEQKRSDPPVINITVPPAPAPAINVNIPKLDATMKVRRDASGRIASAELS